MPPRRKVTREAILAMALECVREEGMDSLNCRNLAKKLGCSTQPVFSNYASMEELKGEVLKSVYGIWQDFTRREMEQAEDMKYKASGMAYIRFAREQPEFFRLLFMRDRRSEPVEEMDVFTAKVVDMVAAMYHISRDRAEEFHVHMWVYVHGIATMVVTGYLEWDEAVISKMLSVAFLSLKTYYLEEEGGRV